jgi:RNA polymerase sigma-70 factor (ECF subfamily)
MSVTPEEFAVLLARVRQGDQSAVAALVQQYEPEVRLVARVLLGSALRPYLDTVDLVQSVHRSLLIGLRQDKYALAGPENLVALALTLVRRKVARQWRRAQRQQRLSGGPADPAQLAHLLASLGSPQPDPAQAAQFNDAIQHLCNNLNETERQLLILRLQGYSTVEVAREMHVDADVLRVRLSRLRQRLRATGVLTEWL